MRQLESILDSTSSGALWHMQFLFRCFIRNSCLCMNKMDCCYNDVLIAGSSCECIFSSLNARLTWIADESRKEPRTAVESFSGFRKILHLVYTNLPFACAKRRANASFLMK